MKDGTPYLIPDLISNPCDQCQEGFEDEKKELNLVYYGLSGFS